MFDLTSNNRLHFYEALSIYQSHVVEAEERIRQRVLRLFQMRKLLSKKDVSNMLSWEHSGFSLHHDTRVHSEDRDGLERLLRYCARPAFSSENLTWIRPGQLLVYRPSKPINGKCYGLHLSPLQLMDLLAELVPPPRANLTHYYGVFAPNAPMRQIVTAYAGRPIPHHNSPEAGLLRLLRKKRKRTGANYEWAELIKHI